MNGSRSAFIFVRLSQPLSRCNCVIGALLMYSSHAGRGGPFWRVQSLAIVSRAHRLQRVYIWEWICSTRVTRIPAFG